MNDEADCRTAPAGYTGSVNKFSNNAVYAKSFRNKHDQGHKINKQVRPC